MCSQLEQQRQKKATSNRAVTAPATVAAETTTPETQATASGEPTPPPGTSDGMQQGALPPICQTCGTSRAFCVCRQLQQQRQLKA